MPRSPLYVGQQSGGGTYVSNATLTTGQIWYVDSATGTDAVGYGQTPDAPFDSMNYCDTILAANSRGNKGDVVIVMPGHTETISTAGGCDLNTAGVTWKGVGSGASTPVLSFGGVVGADLNVDAAGITLENFRITTTLDALTGPIDVNANAFTFKNILFEDGTGQVTDFIVADANADKMVIDGLRYIGASAAGTNAMIALIGCDDVEIKNCFIFGNFAVGAIDCRTTAVVRLWVHDCSIRTVNAADICIVDTITGSTGNIGPNLYLSLQDDSANITTSVTGATFRVFDPVYVVNANNEKAMLINWTASTHA